MKRILSIVFIACFIVGIFCSTPTVSAADIKQGIVEVGTVEGITGEEVVVPVSIKENPGIMAVTISVTYDPAALEYFSYYYGNVFNDYTVAAHPDRKLVRVVICETRNKKKDGNIISLRFKVKKDAKAELSPITVEYSRGDFCNWDLDKILPEVVSGGVEVAFNGENCPHKKYGEWSVVTEPVCKEVGVKVRTCEFCGHNDYKEIKAIGHTYSDTWTVDKPATKDSDGTMSRYCIRCDDYVDRITFSLEQSDKEEIDNTIWEDFPDKETAEDIFEEQNPGKKPTKNPNNQKPSSGKNESSSKPSSGSSSSSKDKVSSATSSKGETSSAVSSKDETSSGSTSSKDETSSSTLSQSGTQNTNSESSESGSDKTDITSNDSSKNSDTTDKKPQNNSRDEATSNDASSDKDSSSDNPSNKDNSSEQTTSNESQTDNNTTESKPSNKPQKPDEKEEDTSSKVDILEQILPEIETEDGENISVYQKLTEAFPEFKTAIEIARVLIILLMIIIIL